MDPAEAAFLAAAYAAETRNIIDGEAFVAERRYRQQLIGAQALRANMIRAMKKREEAFTDVARVHCMMMTATAGANYCPAPIEGCSVDRLYEDAIHPGDLERLHSQYIFNNHFNFTNSICRYP
jgi:hypothetical protein